MDSYMFTKYSFSTGRERPDRLLMRLKGLRSLEIQAKKGPYLHDHIGEYLSGLKAKVQTEVMERHVRSFA